MTRVSISDARKDLPSVIASTRSEAVYLERHGRVVGVLVDPQHYAELLEAYEDIADLTAFDEAMAEEGPNIPWEQVKADLGLT